MSMCSCFDDAGTKWDVALCATCKTDPKFCLVGCCCPWCLACYQRELLLYDKMEEYLCCQGVFGTTCCCPNQVKKCPHCCLCLEVLCCLGCSIKGNRKIMKDNYSLDDTSVEWCTMCIISIFSIASVVSSALVFCMYGCIHAQHEREWIKAEQSSSLEAYHEWKDDNQLYNICKCEPCCGEPCNCFDGFYCCICWTFCSICSSAKLLSSSQQQKCAIVNHFLPYFLSSAVSGLGEIPYVSWAGLLILQFAQRHNARVREGTGDIRYMFGDAILANCCLTALCSQCQTLRTYPREDWDWFGDMRQGNYPVLYEEFEFLRKEQ